MPLPDELTFLETPLRRITLRPGWGGVARIAGWALFFLIVFNILAPRISPRLPYMEPMARQGLTAMSSSASDPRWVRGDIQEMKKMKEVSAAAAQDKEARPKTAIAWIAGSSILIPPKEIPEETGELNFRFIPGETKRFLAARHGMESEVYVYMMLARRMLDSYTMTLDALSRKPDALVIIVNPFWVMNDWAVFNKTNLFNRGASLWWGAGDWRLAALTTSPGNLLWAAAGQRLPLIAQGSDYLKTLNAHLRNLTDFDLKSLRSLKSTGQEPEKRKFAVPLTYDPPLSFWVIHKKYGGDADKLAGASGLMKVLEWQKEAMALSAPVPGGRGEAVMIRLLEAVKDSGLPALIYLAPLSPDMIGNEDADRAYSATYKALKKFKATYEEKSAGRIKILLRLPREVSSGMEFSDFLHLRHEGPFPAFLAREISSIVKEARKEKEKEKEK